MGETFLSIENVTKSFAQTTVVRNVDIAIDKGEFVSFLGPSGCGKTTTLRMVAGFENPTAGRIVIDGKDVTDLKVLTGDAAVWQNAVSADFARP